MLEEERTIAVDKAKEYETKNPGDSYGYGKNGAPGEPVDCSAMVDNCLKDAGYSDYKDGSSNGASNMVNNMEKVSTDEAQVGNMIAFLDPKAEGKKATHVGIIVGITKDEEGNVADIEMIDSGGTQGSGKSGPRRTNIPLKDKKNYWTKRLVGVYKWDKKPESTQKSNKNPNNSKSNLERNGTLARDLTNLFRAYVYLRSIRR